MLSFLGKKNAPASGTVEVGWVIDPNWEASFIWDAPHKFYVPHAKSSSPISVTKCPAVNDHEARQFEITCPIDLHLRFGKDEKGQPALIAIDGDMSSVRLQHLNKLVGLMTPHEWRHPGRPMLQIKTPYFFVADEPAYITMAPAFYHYPARPLPGLVIGGRFPIHIWPRPLAWAFEWHDPSQEIHINRGEPWFYVSFEILDPSRHVRLVEVEMTKELREYTNGIRSVTSYVGRAYSLFSTAKQRRPEKLITPKKR